MIETEKKKCHVYDEYQSVSVLTTTLTLTRGGSLFASADSNVGVDLGVREMRVCTEGLVCR